MILMAGGVGSLLNALLQLLPLGIILGFGHLSLVEALVQVGDGPDQRLATAGVDLR